MIYMCVCVSVCVNECCFVYGAYAPRLLVLSNTAPGYARVYACARMCITLMCVSLCACYAHLFCMCMCIHVDACMCLSLCA